MSYCFRALLICSAAVLALAVDGSDAWCQEEMSLRELATKGRTVQSWARAPITSKDRETFDQYFERYYFPAMMKTDADSLENLADMRSDLFDRYIWDAHPSVQKELTAKAFTFARAVVINKRYPAPIRYNALLILGQLDDKYASRNDPTLKPLAAANDLLCKIVNACTGKQSLPNYMEVGALVGLERHTKHFEALSAGSKKDTALVLLAAVKQTKFPAGTSREVQNWMKLQAATATANMGIAGSKGVFAKAVASLVADDKMDLDSRATAARLLSKIDMAGVPASAGAEIASAVKGLACGIAEFEREQAEKFVEVQSRRSYAADPDQKSTRFRSTVDGWEYERRALEAQLQRLNSGLSAVAGAAGDSADAIATIQRAIANTLEIAGDENIDLDVTDSIRDMHAEITRVGGCQPQDDAAGEDEEELLGAAG